MNYRCAAHPMHRSVDQALLLALALGLPLAGCSRSARPLAAQQSLPTSSQSQEPSQPGADRPGEWTLPGRDYAATRYSPLNQITTENAKNLQVAWTFSTGVNRGHEGTPLVVDNTMYVVTPHPNIVYAIDLANPTGPLKDLPNYTAPGGMVYVFALP